MKRASSAVLTSFGSPLESIFMKKKPYYTISTLKKGLEILECLAEHGPLNVSEVARKLSQNRSAAHRFLATLRDMYYVRQDEQGRYLATLKLFGLGSRVVNRMEIRSFVNPVMSELAKIHDETVNLGCLEEGEIVVLDRIASKEPLKYDLPEGSRGPAYAAAMGKAILAFSGDRFLENYLDEVKLVGRTPHTLTTRESMVAELEKIRKKGYSVDNEEWTLGIRCLAMPIFDYEQKPAFAMSLSGPIQRMTDGKIKNILTALHGAVREVSAMLGSKTYPPVAR